MKKLYFILLINCLFLLFSQTPEARQRGVDVRPSGPELFEAGPKTVVTTTFAVTNTSDEELEFMSDVTLPDGWKLITPSFPFRLAPNATEIKLVSFFIPRNAPAGEYEINYLIRSCRYPSISAVARIFVTVLSVTKLQAKLLEIPDHVIAGDDYAAIFSVINESNTAESVFIQVQSSHGLPFTVLPEKIELAPGETKPVTVHVMTGENIRKGFTHSIRLTARSAEDENIQAQATTRVKIVPRITGETDRFHRIPAEITVRAAGRKGEETEHMLQGEFAGSGSLDEQGDHRVEFLFRGPDTLDDCSVFGDYDRYFAGYQYKRLSLRLGDDYYFLSRLTEQGIAGRGIYGSLDSDDFKFNGYHMETRRLDPEEQETGLQLGYVFNDRYRMGLNLFNKKDDTDDRDDNRIASLHGKLEPFSNSGIEFEAAYGTNDSGHDTAYWLNLYGSPAWGGSYRLEYIYAEPDFPGYYQDKAYLSGNFFFPVKKRFSINGTLRQEKQNLDLDMMRESASLERYGMLGFNYRMDNGTTLSLETRGSSRKDRLPDPGFDDRELTVRARVSQSFNRCFFNASGEWGDTDDRLTDATSRVSIYEGSVYVMPTDHQTYGAFVRYSIDGESAVNNREILNAGINGSIRWGRSTRLDLRLEKYEHMGTEDGDRHTIDAALSHRLANPWTFLVRGRHTIYDDNSCQCDESEFFVELSMPVGVPVSRKKSVGMIKGAVRDQETGAFLANAIVRLNGASAVTGHDGKFVFPAIKPGKYYLDIDQASIGLDRIPMQNTPLALKMTGGDVVSFSIDITRSADLTGRIVVYDFFGQSEREKGFIIAREGRINNAQGKTEELTEVGGLANVLVEFSSRQETWRVMTDRNGRFRFDKIRPGRLTLTAYADNLPQYHYFENNRIEIELVPGDPKEVLMRVLPRQRTIQMIEEGEILIEVEN